MQSNRIKNRRMVDGITRRPRAPEAFASGLSEESSNTVPSSKRGRSSGLKMASVATLVILVFGGLSTVGSTVSYFYDMELSIGNRLQAGSLGLNISSQDDSQSSSRFSVDVASSTENDLGDSSDVEENVGSQEFNIVIDPDTDSFPITYTVSGLLDASNPLGCEEMDVVASLGDFNYSGKLNSFLTPPMSEMGEWHFEVELPKDIYGLAPDVECKGEIVFKAGLAEVADDLTHTFSDEKKYFFVIKNWDEAPVLEEENLLRSPQIELSEPFIPAQPGAESEGGGAGGEASTDDVPELPVDDPEEATTPALPAEEEAQASEPEPEAAIEDEVDEPEVEEEESADESSDEPSQGESAPASDGGATE